MTEPSDWRTLLFVPADNQAMVAKAQRRGADALLVDLEDAIAPSQKPVARSRVAEGLRCGALDGSAAVCLRINAIGEGAEDDMVALAGLDVAGVVLPKTDSPDVVHTARGLLDEYLADGPSVQLIPLVESARGLTNLAEIAACGGVAAIALGGEDLCADLGVTRSADSTELQVPRALVVLHARAHALAAIDTVYTSLDDPDGLVRDAASARQVGFTGKMLIHPRQIEPVRRVFAPTESQIAWARRVIASEREGAGVQLVDGQMIDAPLVAQAQHILARVN